LKKDGPEVSESLHDQEQNLIQPNAENSYEVVRADLPLSCPMPGMHLWNSHPKVYLPIEDAGSAACPYCGAAYSLKTD
jgi:uncharacterized Zn-finger protein